MKQPAEILLVTVVQSYLYWENKQANLEMFENKLKGLNERMEVVLFPEMFNTGFSMRPAELAETMDGQTVAWMKRISSELKIILAGSLIISDNGKFYNRLVWMLPDGTYGYYDKRHLFAFAGEDDSFSPGNKRLIASVKGWKLNMMVCYDLRFPVWSRQARLIDNTPGGVVSKPKEDDSAQPEYDVLVYLANWPEKRIHAWKTLLQARAIENQCYVVGVNRTGEDGLGILYTGDSMVVDPMGEIISSAPPGDAIFTCTLRLDKLSTTRQRLPFLKDADFFVIAN